MLSRSGAVATSYARVQDGIIPAWEDENNKWGGKWSIQLPKDKNRGNVDRMWLYTASLFRPLGKQS